MHENQNATKFVYHKLDQHVVRNMLICCLVAAAEMTSKQIPSKIDEDYMQYLCGKADIFGDLGGAKLAFVIKTMLLELFTSFLKQSPEKAEVLCEMILGMAMNVQYVANADSPEGPKREV